MSNYKELEATAQKTEQKYLKHKARLLNSLVIVLFIILITAIIKHPIFSIGSIDIPLFSLALIPLALGIDVALLRAKAKLATNLAEDTLAEYERTQKALRQRIMSFVAYFFYYEQQNDIQVSLTTNAANAPLTFNKVPMLWLNYSTESKELSAKFGPLCEQHIDPFMTNPMKFEVGDKDIKPINPDGVGQFRQFLLFNDYHVDRVSYLPSENQLMFFDAHSKQLKPFNLPKNND